MKLKGVRNLLELEVPYETWWVGIMGRNSFPVLCAGFFIHLSPPHTFLFYPLPAFSLSLSPPPAPIPQPGMPLL